jgi:LL-diaminopimelate aminotransferase
MPKPKASMFVWAPIPGGYKTSMDFCTDMLERAGVLFIPGNAFGAMGEGYVRIGLVQEEDIMREAVERVAKALKQRSRL